MIKTNRQTEFPAYVSDYLPTFLDITGMAHPHPDWAADGISLMSLIRQAAAMEPSLSLVVANRTKPLGFQLGSQTAWIDNDWKVVQNPGKGQCKKMLPPYNKPGASRGPFLFNLVSDPTESHDLSKQQPARFASMVAAMNSWSASIKVSQVKESQCAQGGGSGPAPPAPPMPPTPPSGGFTLNDSTGHCLTLSKSSDMGSPKLYTVIGPCDGGSKWEEHLENGFLSNLGLPKGTDIIKLDAEGREDPCTLGNTIWTGADSPHKGFTPTTVGSTTLIASAECKTMYAGKCATGLRICLVARSEAMEFTRSDGDSTQFGV